ncbi:hypothetical protein FGADI_13558 [Fusarium gaditjirri]|uniref:Uncharacterized protein n=1 Tax=Fusarium gaditjirri TaxID=282569 RepID=A0A8H4SPN7_9HYPO|nr:hypothetical protein FGADI_13558 [Fusarium gaditjirri]
MDYYRVKLPLATVAPYEHAGDDINDPHRVLYINPAIDTIVVLGDLDYSRISRLLTGLRVGDPAGKGLQNFAVSASWTYHQGAGDTIRMIVKHMFPELVEMTVFMYDEKMPPADWAGGTCELQDCSHTDYYKRVILLSRDAIKTLIITIHGMLAIILLLGSEIDPFAPSFTLLMAVDVTEPASASAVIPVVRDKGLAWFGMNDIATKMSMNESDCTVLPDGFPGPFPDTPANVLEQFRMTGKVVVVTGGADGFGYAVAEGMAEANAHVVLWYNCYPEVPGSWDET